MLPGRGMLTPAQRVRTGFVSPSPDVRVGHLARAVGLRPLRWFLLRGRVWKAPGRGGGGAGGRLTTGHLQRKVSDPRSSGFSLSTQNVHARGDVRGRLECPRAQVPREERAFRARCLQDRNLAAALGDKTPAEAAPGAAPVPRTERSVETGA